MTDQPSPAGSGSGFSSGPGSQSGSGSPSGSRSGSRSQSREAQGTRRALEALATQLDQTAGEVAGTLHEELTRALAEIDSGIAAGDAEVVGRASHAARNSVLMLDDRPMLTGLRSLEAATTHGDRAATNAARSTVQERWDRLAEVLRDV